MVLICPCGVKSKETMSSSVVDKSEESGFYYVPTNDGELIWLCEKCNRKAVDLAAALLGVTRSPHTLLPVLLQRSFVGWTCAVCDKDFTFRENTWVKPIKYEIVPVFGFDGSRMPFAMTMNLCKGCHDQLGDPKEVRTSCQHDCMKAYFTKTKERIELKGTYQRD